MTLEIVKLQMPENFRALLIDLNVQHRIVRLGSNCKFFMHNYKTSLKHISSLMIFDNNFDSQTIKEYHIYIYIYVYKCIYIYFS